MSAHLELLTGVLVHVGRTDDRVQVALGRQRDGAGNASTGLLSGLNDELGGLIDDLVIIALQADPDLLAGQLNLQQWMSEGTLAVLHVRARDLSWYRSSP